MCFSALLLERNRGSRQSRRKVPKRQPSYRRTFMAENRIDEEDVLNFALNLEYLEAEFYTYATTGKSITSFGVGIKGRAAGANPADGGNTVGGRKVAFP